MRLFLTVSVENTHMKLTFDFYSANLHADMIKCTLYQVLYACLITYLAKTILFLQQL
jgi:hypothetical protein